MSVKYRGIKYRSRVEARWAAFFHHLHWEAVYDPFAHGSPTFLVRPPDGPPLLLEVTESVTEEGCREHGNAALHPAAEDVLVVGVSPHTTGVLFGPEADGEPREWDGPFAAAWAKATNDVRAAA